MKLLTLDGNSIVSRAYFGIRPLTAPDGTPTNAVYGFLSILKKLIDDEKPDALCVAFDVSGVTFRNDIYKEYKAHRPPTPEDFAVQMPIVKEVLDAMNIPRFELNGWEADDLLGSIAKHCQDDGWECVIVTGDKDVLQLVTNSTRVRHVKTRAGKTETINYTPEVFIEEYGFEPRKIIDLKALMGDSSDNIPGVVGVGEKTASDLVRRFGSLSHIYENLNELDIKEAVRKKLEVGKENALMSYELAEIRFDAPLDIKLCNSLRQDIDNDRLFELFKRLGFRRFISEYGLRQPSGSLIHDSEIQNEGVIKQSPNVVDVTNADECNSLLRAAKEADFIAVGLDTEFFESAAISIPCGKGETAKVYRLNRNDTDNFDNILAELLSDKYKKAGHGVKDIIRACLDRGGCFAQTCGWVFDTALAAYLIQSTDSNYNLKRISEHYTGFSPGSSDEESGQMTLTSFGNEALADDAFAIALLKVELDEKLKESELEKLYYEIELPLCAVLAKMEHTGFLIDKKALTEFGQSLGSDIKEIEDEVYRLAGEEFNINSPKQLGEVLFDRLMLPAPKKTKTGYSTNVDVLDKLLGKHPIIAQIKDYRELSKLKSTYADGLLKVINPDGRIHTRFMMTVTATGRLSSTEPNLQNIPIRRKKGEEIRKMFVAAEGNCLVDADYSQIELRILAHIAGDPVMLNAFESGEDIHTVTASQVFGVPLTEVTSMMRSRAKAVNFGIVYGISAFSLSQDIGVSPYEAKAYIASYLEKYSEVSTYMTDIVASAKKLGYVSTLYGRRRYLPELKSPNFNMRAFGERVALNMPIQGTAADIMKIAMINVSRRLEKEALAAKIILQVHDELIIECPEAEAERVSLILKDEMENAAKLSVPLVVETNIGKSWYDTK